VHDERFPAASRLAWIAFGLTLIVVATYAVRSFSSAQSPAPRAGFVDLSHWNFARDGTARLAGEWLFFEGRWKGGVGDGHSNGIAARIPGAWPASNRDGALHADGFGTYTLTLKLPAPSQGDAFAIDTGQLRSAYRLYAGDKLIASGGTPATAASGERVNSYSSMGVLPAPSRVVTLRLEVSNHLNRYGGVFTAATVGLASAVEGQRRMVEMLSLIMVGALLFAACYHFAFSFIIRGGQVHLWFASLAALVGLRNFLIEPLARNVVPLIGQDWVWRMDFIVTSLALPCAYWFIALSFKRHLSWRIGVGITAFCTVAAAVILIAGPAIGDYALKSVELLACAMIVYLTWAIVRASWENEKGATLALTGWLLLSVAIVHDMLIAGSNAITFGCIAYFVCLSAAITSRSQAAHEKVVNLSAELKSVNARLEAAVGERTVELKQKILELETQQIALEESRAAAVSANETKSRFLATRSHELRTPLNAILGFSEIIHSRLFGVSVERYADYAADIHASGRRLLALIDDILDLSKIEAGKLELFEVQLELDAQIRAAMNLVEVRAAAKSVRLLFEPEISLAIVADERALQQILVNLLTNAVKFTRSGGQVNVRVDREADASTIVVIEDTGIGIKPADMDHVFQSFGQARHDIVATQDRGTGLGLPIVKGLVEAHGGTFTIESTVGVGTKAVVRFPPRRAAGDRGRDQAA
jgi:signal transduction histidine kinase